MNLQDLENILREKGAQDLPKVDTAQLWQRVKPHILKEDKRKPLLFRWRYFLGLLFFAVILSAFLMFQNEADNEKIPDYIILDSATINDHNNITSKNNSQFNASDSQDIDAIKIQAENKIATEVRKRQFINKQNTPDQSNAVNNIVIEQNEIRKKIKSAEGIEELSINQKSKLKASFFSTTPSVYKPNYDLQNISDKSLVKNSNNFELELPSNLILNNKIQNESAHSDKKTKEPLFVFDANKVNQISNRFISSVSSALNNTVSTTILDELQFDDIAKNYNLHVAPLSSDEFLIQPKIIPFNNNMISNRWMLSIGTGAFSASKNMTLENNSRIEDFANRSASESILDAWNINLSVYYNWHPNISWSLGIDYSWINEESKSTLITQNQIELEQVVVAMIVDGNSVEDVFARNVVVNQTIEQRIRRINTYKWIDIPLEIIYSSPLSGKVSIDVGLGFSKNIALRTSGYWHPNNTEEYGLDLDKGKYLRGTNGFSLIGHLGLRYELSNKFGLYSRVRMKNQMSSLTSPAYGINQSYRLIGLEAGLISKF